MKIEIEIKSPSDYGNVLTMAFTGGAGKKQIHVTSGSFDLGVSTNFVVESNGKITQLLDTKEDN